MEEMKKKKLILGIIVVVLLLLGRVILALLAGVVGYFVLIKKLDKKLENPIPADVPEKKRIAKEKPVKKHSVKEEQIKDTPAKAEPVRNETVKEEPVNEEPDPDAWTEQERKLNDQLEEIFNNRRYFANANLGALCSEVMECCTSQKRKEAYYLLFAKLQIDLMMLQRMFSGLILGDYGVELTENIDVMYFKDKSIKEHNEEFDKLADNFYTYDGWEKLQNCGAHTAFQNMWFYALRRPLDTERFEKAKEIYNFYTAIMMIQENGAEVEIMDHWAVLATFACFKEDPSDEKEEKQISDIVEGWCRCHYDDEYKEQLASGLNWLKHYEAEYKVLCSMFEKKPELEQRTAELALIYG